MDYIIETENLTKRYGTATVVDKVNLHVPKGKIYGLLGRNGAGKTTLFNAVSGFSAPSSGEVYFCGENFTDKTTTDYCIKGLARTFQNIRLFTGMTVLENILVGQHDHLKAGFLASILHTGAQKKEEKEAHKAH